jgi:hypothetical protein
MRAMTANRDVIVIPVKKIDSIPVAVIIKKSALNLETGRMRLDLNIWLDTETTFGIDDIDDGKIILFNYYSVDWHPDYASKNVRVGDIYTDVHKVLRNVMDSEQCWFDKFDAKFILGKKNIDALKLDRECDAAFVKAFGKKKALEMNSNYTRDCCVCYEPTIGITGCGHSLCIPCMVRTNNEIDRSDEGEDDDGELIDEKPLPCPLCRQCIIASWKNKFNS